LENTIYFQAASHECREFILQGKKQAVSAVIAPLKVTETDNSIRLNSGCNMWEHCENKLCHFAMIAHPPLKEKK
jgi:hypothetical protein